MLKQFLHPALGRVLMLAVITVLLAACGGGSGDTSSVTAADSSTADDIVLTGSIGDGPVTGATVEVWSSHGDLLATLKSDNTATFNSRIRVKRSSYPLLLKVLGGTDLVTGKAPDFQMTSVMLDRQTREVNINPFSTLIVKVAQFLPGGLNAANTWIARGIVTGTLGFGLSQDLTADPISTTITDANVASLLKSSEAMGEMIRRTRDQMLVAGRNTSGDAVLAAIAADLRDGSFDGLGAGGTDPRITAVAKVVSAQVLVEALSNNLRVEGVIATDIIDQAIAITRPGYNTVPMTQSVQITDGMLQQTLAALAAARLLDTSAEVIALETVVSGIAPGALPGDVEKILPASSSLALDNAMMLAATADATLLAAVNTGAQAGTPDQGTTAPGATAPDSTLPANSLPVISGIPAYTVQAGTFYRFQPGASDADGDVLTFSITGRPAWAAFDPATGRLSGTPGSGDTGTYSNIVIAVTDGTDTASLPGFSITVDPAPVASGNFTLAWTPPVARADGSPLSLTEIGGFRIYYGPSAGNYPDTVDVSDGGAQSATVNNLPAGTYHVVMTSYDTSGLESGISAEVVKVVY